VCGCAFASVGGPCVLHRVWPTPWVGRVRHVRDGEPVDLTRPLRDREPARFTHERDARRVVAAVLQVAEPLVDDRTHAVDRAAVGVGRAPSLPPSSLPAATPAPTYPIIPHMIIPPDDRARFNAPVDHDARVGSHVVADHGAVGERRAAADGRVIADHTTEFHVVMDRIADDHRCGTPAIVAFGPIRAFPATIASRTTAPAPITASGKITAFSTTAPASIVALLPIAVLPPTVTFGPIRTLPASATSSATVTDSRRGIGRPGLFGLTDQRGVDRQQVPKIRHVEPAAIVPDRPRSGLPPTRAR